ncbi:MAG: hypothetical protein ACPHGZ_04975, partial [Schleiferiaceae bacterium]
KTSSPSASFVFLFPNPQLNKQGIFFASLKRSPRGNRSNHNENQVASGALCFFMPYPLTEASFVRVKA